MRTAKEWVNEKLCINEDYDPEGKGDKQWEEEMQYVNAVRLEAFRAGMTKAAEMLAAGDELFKPNPYWQHNIEAIRDSLTALP